MRGSWTANTLSLVAVFFALGGSAFAFSAASKPAFVTKCGPGAIEPSATVVGTNKGLANVPDTYTSDKSIFSKSFTCRGGDVQIKRVDVGLYDVRFLGNPAGSAVVSGLAETATSASPKQADSSFRVSVFVTGTDQGVLLHRDLAFSILAFA